MDREPHEKPEVVGCRLDTDGDGNCPIHPLGCPNKEPYEPPEVVEQSVEEMLSEAQSALDGVFHRHRKALASLSDLEAVASSLGEEIEGLATELADAERLVQKVTYVAKVKGEQDAATDRS